MSQKKVERNVFIHYNVRLRLRNMKRARNQGEQPNYCPINLDYIFAEDDPLLPWLENREKEIEVINSEEENIQSSSSATIKTPLQRPRQGSVIELHDDSSATHTDVGGDDDDDDDDDDDGGNSGQGTGGGGEESGDRSRSFDDMLTGILDHYFVPSSIPYPHGSSTSQPQRTTDDRGKNPIIHEEDEEEEDEEEGSTLGSNVYAQQLFYPYYSQEPSQGHQFGAEYESYLFGGVTRYPENTYHSAEYTSNNNDDDDNVQEPPRHSFWW